jgi:hypothetical protein
VDEGRAVVNVERLLHRSPQPLDDRDAALLADRSLVVITAELLQGAGKGVSLELPSLVRQEVPRCAVSGDGFVEQHRDLLGGRLAHEESLGEPSSRVDVDERGEVGGQGSRSVGKR